MRPQYVEDYGFLPVTELQSISPLSRFSPAYWGLAKELANLNLSRDTVAPKQKVAQPKVVTAVKQVSNSAYIDAKMREARQLRAEKFEELISAAVAGIRNGISRLVSGNKGPKIMAHR